MVSPQREGESRFNSRGLLFSSIEYLDWYQYRCLSLNEEGDGRLARLLDVRAHRAVFLY